MSEPRLILEWVDPPTVPSGAWWWAQVVSGMHRLVEIRDRFDAVSRMRDARKALAEFRVALELSWWHCYSVRERVIELLGVVSGSGGLAGKMKKPSARCAAQAALSLKAPVLTDQVAGLLKLLDATVARRNDHTHNNYVGISLDLEHDSFDPDDVLDQLAGSPDAPAVAKAIAKSVRAKARECRAHLQCVIDVLSDLVMQNQEALRDAVSVTGISQVAFP